MKAKDKKTFQIINTNYPWRVDTLHVPFTAYDVISLTANENLGSRICASFKLISPS